MGRHHDQVGFFRLRRVQNCLGRIALGQHASDGQARKLRPERLVQVFLGLSCDFRKHVPTSKLGTALRHTCGMALRCHDVQHHNIRMEMVGQCSSLMNHPQRGIREINRQKNLLNVRHRAPAGESKCLAAIVP